MLENTTIRKVQAYAGEKSLTIVLPRNFTVDLGIEKGDFLKVQMENRRLILEKAEL
jgi:antitoxin component of MazEF toxin-antitoxin module